jgi:hypothetical protein
MLTRLGYGTLAYACNNRPYIVPSISRTTPTVCTAFDAGAKDRMDAGESSPLLGQLSVGEHLHVDSANGRSRLKRLLLSILRVVPVRERNARWPLIQEPGNSLGKMLRPA